MRCLKVTTRRDLFAFFGAFYLDTYGNNNAQTSTFPIDFNLL